MITLAFLAGLIIGGAVSAFVVGMCFLAGRKDQE